MVTSKVVCQIEDVPCDIPLRVQIDGLPILAVYRLSDGVYVTDATCTHGDAPLTDGYLEDDEIECPYHGGRFCVRTGRPTAFPATEALRTYPARVESGAVIIEVEKQ